MSESNDYCTPGDSDQYYSLLHIFSLLRKLKIGDAYDQGNFVRGEWDSEFGICPGCQETNYYCRCNDDYPDYEADYEPEDYVDNNNSKNVSSTSSHTDETKSDKP